MDGIKKKFSKWNSIMKRYDKMYNWIIFTLLFIVVSFVALYHEPFRDEVQAWNIARDLSVFDIFFQMRSEGHPCIWHLILKPFTMIGLPVYSMTWVSVVIMMVTAWLILFKSPFCKFVRAALVFSSPFLYFYSIVSRSYCLIALCITLLCLVYNKRREKPLAYGLLLFFLFNTHVIMAGMASILLFFFIVETLAKSLQDRKFNWMNVWGCLIGFLGGIVLCFQLLGSYNSNSLVANFGVENYGLTYLEQYIDFFINQYKLEYYYFTDVIVADQFILPIVVVLLVSILVGLIFFFKNTFIFIISYLFSLFVCIFLFYSITLRAIVLIFLLMFLSWTVKERKINGYTNKVMCFLEKHHISSYLIELSLLIYCFLSIPYGVKCMENDVDHLMTDAPNVAEFIKNNIDTNDIILAPSENLTTVILGYLPDYSLYNIENQRFFTFITWDKDLNVGYDQEQLDLLLQKMKQQNENVYLLYTPAISLELEYIVSTFEAEGRLELLYKSEHNYYYLNSAQEFVNFKIYRVDW